MKTVYKYNVYYTGDLEKDPLNYGNDMFDTINEAIDFFWIMQNKGYTCEIFECKLLDNIDVLTIQNQEWGFYD